MRKLNIMLLFSCLALTSSGCDDENDRTAEPIAPILKDVVMPTESNTIPGTTVTISGKGFDVGDILYCTSLSQEKDFTPEVTEVTDYGISIAIPSDAAGSYEVEVERAGKVSKLPEVLKVAYVIVIEDLVMPAGTTTPGGTIQIKGSGFENGDKLVFTSDAYPANVSATADVTLTDEGIEAVVPASCYGVNTLTLTRGNRQGRLGTVNIAVAIGDEIGGGIVYYVSDGGIHGLIAKRTNTGTATEQWGPTSEHGGTKKEIYTGKENTRLCVEAMKVFHQKFETWPASKKSAAEQCDAETETVDGIVYDDWFLPSQEELIQLFYQKKMLAEKGAAMPANNYWSSTEGDADDTAAAWSAYYVNFYEEENLVTAASDKEGWTIGIRAIRQF